MKAIMMKIAGISVEEVHSKMGIKPGMSADEVKKAKRAYAVKNHPDKHPGDAKKAQEFASTMGGFDDHYDGDHKRRASSSGGGSSKPGKSGKSDGPGKSHDAQWDSWSADDKKQWRDAHGYDNNFINQAKSAKNVGHGITAGSLAGSALMSTDILRAHMQKKKLESEGHHDDAALAKSVRNRRAVGQGVGYLAGALLGHKGYKGSKIHKGLSHAGSKQHLNRLLDDKNGANKINRSFHSASVTGGGMVGQTLGGTIGELAAWKKRRQLNKNTEARERAERSKG